MIMVTTSHYNSDAISALRDGFKIVVNITRHACGVELPGYDSQCATCPSKQGCRDFTRAYYHLEGVIK